MKLGIIREGKVPSDARVPLNPAQCAAVLKDFDLELVVQPSPGRCFADVEYQSSGIPMQKDVSQCEVLLGVKEVPIEQLLPNKTYLFFSHTIKAQAYNQPLLKAVVEKKIRLIDYEVLTDALGRRLIAFGKFAGMVGAHNGLLTYGLRTGAFDLQRMHKFKDYAAAKAAYATMEWPPLKVVLTGTGRVANGAALVLRDMGIQQLTPAEFLSQDFQGPVFTQLSIQDYVARKDGTSFEDQDFFQNPQNYKSIFAPYTQVADIMVNGIYWDNAAPAFFSKEEMSGPAWNIGVIADVTCDIAPVSSIPSTLRASTIDDPFFAYDPKSYQEVAAFTKGAIDMMTIDNLPNELPRDASTAFGQQFIEHILPEFFKNESDILLRATIAQNGDLGPHFEYLRDYLNGKFDS